MEMSLDYGDLPELDRDAFAAIAELVYRHTGMRLGARKGYFVVGRLGRLFCALGCRSWQELPVRLAEHDERVLQQLIASVVTPETRFFRDGTPFRALLEKIVPEWRGGVSEPLRVWSAGCSTGQEPYSIVMALWPLLETGALDLQVWATDLCGRSLERARRATYAEHELHRGVCAAQRNRFFDPVPGSTSWMVRPEIRRYVHFEAFNLLADPIPRGAFDVVFCRNVAIYFDRDGKRRLYRGLADALVNGGYLLLGAAETLFPPVAEIQTLYYERCLLFRRKAGGRDE